MLFRDLKGHLRLSLFLVGMLAFVVTAGAATDSPLDPDQLKQRLDSLKTLLESSSAAKQIESGRNANSLAERDRAFALWRKAEKALEAGDLVAAQKRLQEVSRVMFVATRLAPHDDISAEKAKRDYLNRRDSIEALMSAQTRISDEKGNVVGAAEIATRVKKMVAEAERLAGSGKYVDARVVADKAYLLVKTSVGSMRSGDTLVRSLNFATEEEEYRYELDRNDTYMMLVDILVVQMGRGNSNIDKLVELSKGLREKAEKAADEGAHRAAIDLLEESTAELVRAIRGTGLYIPS